MAVPVKVLFKKAEKAYQKRDFQGSIQILEQILQSNPEHAESYFMLGNVAKAMEIYETAIKWYDIFLRVSPNSYEAQFNRALCLHQKGDHETAIEAYRTLKIIKGPRHDKLLNNMGILYKQMRRVKLAIHHFKQALDVNPRNADAMVNLADVYFQMRNNRPYFEEQGIAFDPKYWEQFYKKAERFHRTNPAFYVNRASCYFNSGQYEQGWQDYQKRLSPTYANAVNYQHRIPQWTGQSLSGKTLLISEEQGIGDQISFLSVLPELIKQAERVIVEASPKLERLLAFNFPQAEIRTPDRDIISGRHTFRYDWLEHAVDFSAPLGQAFFQLRQNMQSFPQENVFLKADETALPVAAVTTLANEARLKIGISWRSHKQVGERTRGYLSIENVKELVRENPSYQFYCLQYCWDQDEIDYIGVREDGTPYMEVFEEIDLFDDLYSTASLMQEMDYVISVRNTQFCLAAAQGIKTISAKGSQFQFGQLTIDPIYPNSYTVHTSKRSLVEHISTVLADYDVMLQRAKDGV